MGLHPPALPCFAVYPQGVHEDGPDTKGRTSRQGTVLQGLGSKGRARAVLRCELVVQKGSQPFREMKSPSPYLAFAPDLQAPQGFASVLEPPGGPLGVVLVSFPSVAVDELAFLPQAGDGFPCLLHFTHTWGWVCCLVAGLWPPGRITFSLIF